MVSIVKYLEPFLPKSSSEVKDVLLKHKWWILGTTVLSYGAVKLLNGPRKLPPGPWGWPIVGSLFEVSENTIHLDLTRLGNKYGEIYSLYTGQQ